MTISDAEYADAVAAREGTSGSVPERPLAEGTPPAVLAEDQILTTILQDPAAIDRALAFPLTANDFKAPGARAVFEAMVRIQERGDGLDPLALADELKGARDVISPSEYISRLLDFVPNPSGLERYAGLLKQESARRVVITTAQNLIAEARMSANGAVGRCVQRAVEALEPLAAESHGDDRGSLRLGGAAHFLSVLIVPAWIGRR